MEIALNECMKRGREIENNFQNCEKFDLDAYENIPSAYFDLCRASFHVACFEALEEFECSRGKTVAAQKGEKCDGNETDTFKVCATRRLQSSLLQLHDFVFVCRNVATLANLELN